MVKFDASSGVRRLFIISFVRLDFFFFLSRDYFDRDVNFVEKN